ncbi:MAG: response regulator [Candidatus Hydrogenedentes bacterium]|nr:response regulator [Candidatus Hydrogenedentota bacterium]
MSKSANILIVDDQGVNRQILAKLVADLGHSSIQAENGAVALKQLKEHKVDLVLSDVMMPVMTGYQFLEHVKADESLRHIPVVMVSALDEMQSITHCIELGADDYLPKAFNPILLKARLNGCLAKKDLHDKEEEHRDRIERYNRELEERVREQVKEIASTQLALIFALANLAESRDPDTGEHLERMRQYAYTLASKIRTFPQHAELIDDSYIEDLYVAAPLHDIGKVGIPDRILQKPGKLTEEEFEIMKNHATIGATTLRRVDEKHPGNSFLKMGIELAESHHEKWDGTGYPHGLAGADIPLAGRILALADVYDALTSKRCYKEAMPHEKSREILLEGKGKHFDPDVVDAFIDSEEAFFSIRLRYQDTEKTLLV